MTVRPVSSERREQIIAATMRLVASNGVAALSTRKIAREASVNLATLHYLFGSKDELLLAVLDYTTNAMLDAVLVNSHRGSGLRAALADSFTALWALLDETPSLPLLRCEVMLYASRNASLATAAREHHRRYVDALQSFYQAERSDERCMVPFDSLAAVVCCAIDGLALQSTSSATRMESAVTCEQFWCSLFGLVRAQTPSDDSVIPDVPLHPGPSICGDIVL